MPKQIVESFVKRIGKKKILDGPKSAIVHDMERLRKTMGVATSVFAR